MLGSIDTAMVIAQSHRRRYQKGMLVPKHGSWHARYFGWQTDKVGERVWREQSTVLGRLRDYPKRKDILADFQEFMAEINAKNFDLEAHDPSFPYFVERTYFKADQVQGLVKSTRDGYHDIWDLHLKPLLEEHTLTSFRPVNVTRILEQLRDKGLGKRSLQHIKSFISGVYTFARTHGYYDGANPVSGTKLPKTPEPDETYAYSNDEERKMLKVVKSAKARLAIAVASWTGVDKGELEGLRWEDFEGGDLYIRRKIWCGTEKEPKTGARKAPIPVIAHLQKMIQQYRRSVGSPAEGWVFTASRGKKPIRMDNLAKREIKPDLKKAGMQWHGWHAFRRGLATNLSELDVSDPVIQRILRHGDIGTTQSHYRKVLPKSARKAMQKLDHSLKRDKSGTAKSTSL
jgi:integrase